LRISRITEILFRVVVSLFRILVYDESVNPNMREKAALDICRLSRSASRYFILSFSMAEIVVFIKREVKPKKH